MAASYTFAVDNIGDGEQIITQSITSRVRVKQNDQSAATLQPYTIKRPSATSPAVRHEGGEIFDIPLPTYVPVGTVLGYIELVNAATVTFGQIED